MGLSSTPRYRGLWALALALVGCGAPKSDPALDFLPVSPTLPVISPTRGPDPLTINAPLYQISVDYIKTVQPAGPPIPIYTDSEGNSTISSADRVRFAFNVYTPAPNGGLVPAGPQNDYVCQIGQNVAGGMLGTEQLTLPNGLYTTCLNNPLEPDLNGKPMALNGLVSVGQGQQIYLYAQLAVLEPSDPWLTGQSSDDGIGAALVSFGSAVSAQGTILSAVPGADVAAPVVQAFGIALIVTGDLIPTSPPLPSGYCNTASSLVPAFTGGQTSTEAGSPVLRVPLTGLDLWQMTAQGDGVLFYDLNYGTKQPNATLCNQPRTLIQFRVRRIAQVGSPGENPISYGGLVFASYPSMIDAFSVRGTQLLYESRGRDAGLPLAWEVSPSLVSDPVAVGAPDPRDNLLAANANVVGLGRRPGDIDAFAVSTWGDIITAWKVDENVGGAMQFNSSPWQSWAAITHGQKFPSGAPLAVVARDANRIDVFAIGNDGAIWDVAWDQSAGGWLPEVAISPQGEVWPWNGYEWGGIAAAVLSDSNLNVFVINDNWTLSTAWWNAASGWTYRSGLTDGSTYTTWPGSPLAAVSREYTDADVFVTSAQGQVLTTNWRNGSILVPQAWTPVTPTSLPGVRHGNLAVVARRVNDTGNALVDNQYMDVFTVGSDGYILHSQWIYGNDNYQWNTAHTEKLSQTGQPGGPIGAVSPFPGSIQVATVDTDQSLRFTWFEDVPLGSLPSWQLAHP